MGFEPTVPFSTHPFQGCAFDHSANLPYRDKYSKITLTNQETQIKSLLHFDIFVYFYNLMIFNKNDVNSDFFLCWVFPEICIDSMFESLEFFSSDIIMKIFYVIYYFDFYEDTIEIVFHNQIDLSSSDSKIFIFTIISMRFIQLLDKRFSIMTYLLSILIILH